MRRARELEPADVVKRVISDLKPGELVSSAEWLLITVTSPRSSGRVMCLVVSDDAPARMSECRSKVVGMARAVTLLTEDQR